MKVLKPSLQQIQSFYDLAFKAPADRYNLIVYKYTGVFDVHDLRCINDVRSMDLDEFFGGQSSFYAF